MPKGQRPAQRANSKSARRRLSHLRHTTHSATQGGLTRVTNAAATAAEERAVNFMGREDLWGSCGNLVCVRVCVRVRVCGVNRISFALRSYVALPKSEISAGRSMSIWGLLCQNGMEIPASCHLVKNGILARPSCQSSVNRGIWVGLVARRKERGKR